MNWQERISVNPAVRSGKPCIKGTRITVYDVLEYLAGGMSEDEILNDFPDLAREDIRASLAFAAARERRLANSVGETALRRKRESEAGEGLRRTVIHRAPASR